VENAVTLDDIKRFAAKYGIKEFKISASGAESGIMRPMGANSFPYHGDVLVQEYNAPKNDVFSSVPAKYTVTIAGGMSMAKEVVENAVTLDDIKRFAAKYGIKEFKISASGAESGIMRPMGANSFPYHGDVLVQEYNAPKNDVFSSVPAKYTVTIAGGMSMAKEVVENAVTLDDIKRFAAKYGIKEFKISASGAETGIMRPMGANSFPYQGDVLVQEYNAPKFLPSSYGIFIAGRNVTVQVNGAITLNAVKEVALRHGIKEFELTSGGGYPLTADQFPVQHDVVITEYRPPADGVFTSRPLFTTDGFVPETDIIILEPVRHDDDVVVADDRDTAEEDEEEEDEEKEDEEKEDEEKEDEEEEDEEEEDEEEEDEEEEDEEEEDEEEEDEEEEDEEEEDEEEEDEEEEDEEEEDEEEEDEEEPAVPVREQVFSADKQFVFSSVPERYTIIVAGNKRAAMEQVENEISIQALKAVAARYNITTFSVFAQSETTGPMRALTANEFPFKGSVVLREEESNN